MVLIRGLQTTARGPDLARGGLPDQPAAGRGPSKNAQPAARFWPGIDQSA